MILYTKKYQQGGDINNPSKESNELTLRSRYDNMKFGKYITDPVKKQNLIKNVFVSMLDDGFSPQEAERQLKYLGAYGSERGTPNEWGWDHKDIDQKILVKYYKEYKNK